MQLNLKSAGLALFGLSSLAIALPLFSALGRGATFFVVHGAEAWDILLFTFIVFALPPAVMLAATSLIRLFSTAWANATISVVVGVFAALWVAGFVLAIPASIAIGVAAGIGALFSLGYYLRPELREILTIVGYASPAIVMYFLVFTPVSGLLLSGAVFESSTSSGARTPIVMLVLDELPLAAMLNSAQDIDAGRLPNFSRLERIATWYPDTTSASTFTERAVTAILSGRYVDADRLPTYHQNPLNMFSLLAASHEIKAQETITSLCPDSVCGTENNPARAEYRATSMYSDAWIVWLHSIVPVGLAERYLPSISNSWRDFDDSGNLEGPEDKEKWKIGKWRGMSAEQMVRFDRFLSNIRSGTRADLNYLHLLLPHQPWVYLPDGTLYNGQNAPGLTSIQRWESDQYLIDQAVLQFALQLEYVDRLLGELLDVLEEAGRLEETLLIVVADHGLAISTNGHMRKPVDLTLAEVSRVPLFIKYPGEMQSKRDMRKAQTIDILPTIAEVLHLPAIQGLDGQSLISHDWQETPRRILEAEPHISNIEENLDLSGAIDKYLHVVAPGQSALKSLGIGAGKHYVGKPPPVLAQQAAQRSLLLDRPEWYAAIKLDSGFLPSRLTGVIDKAEPGTEILIAVNGIIAGNSRTYDESGRVSIMLDSTLFREGFNELQAYQLDDGSLREMSIASPGATHWKLVKDDDGITTVSDDKGNLYRQDDSLMGSASTKNKDKPIDIIWGWAYDQKEQQAAMALLLVDGEDVISTGFQRDIKPLFKQSPVKGVPESLEYWFSLELDQELVSRKASLTIIAVFNGGRMLEIHPEF